MSWLAMAHTCQNPSRAKTTFETQLTLRPTGCYYAFVHDRARPDVNMTTGRFCVFTEQLTPSHRVRAGSC